MTREMLKPPTRAAVFHKFGDKCVICGYALAQSLQIHHVVPVNLGGKDDLENLTLLCANCHRLVHHYSAKRFATRNLKELAKDALEVDAIPAFETLTQAIHQARVEMEQNNGRVEQPHSWEDALEAVARRNRYNEVKRQQFVSAMSQVVARLPPQVRSRCSFRLMRNEKYISINLMNYLLFRAPAHSDMGGAPVYECFFTAPSNTSLAQWAKAEGHDVFTFTYFDAINLGLSYKELLNLGEKDWHAFSEACLMALRARRSREWPSNISLPTDFLKVSD